MKRDYDQWTRTQAEWLCEEIECLHADHLQANPKILRHMIIDVIADRIKAINRGDYDHPDVENCPW